MGNEQSMGGATTVTANGKERRSIDASQLRQVRSAQNTPRLSAPGGNTIISACPMHNNIMKKDSGDRTSEHKLSTDSTDQKMERRPSRGKMSLPGAEGGLSPMAHPLSRRASRTVLFPEEAAITVAEKLKLTAYHTQLLQSTWMKIRQNSTFFTQVFKLLCSNSPLAREMFHKLSIVESFKAKACTDLAAHARVLHDLIDAVVRDMQQNAKQVEARCTELGEAHWGVHGSAAGAIWDHLGDALAESLSRHDSVRGKREAVKAWITLVSFLMDCMKAGYIDEFRRRHVARASTGHLFEGQSQTQTITAAL